MVTTKVMPATSSSSSGGAPAGQLWHASAGADIEIMDHYKKTLQPFDKEDLEKKQQATENARLEINTTRCSYEPLLGDLLKQFLPEQLESQVEAATKTERLANLTRIEHLICSSFLKKKKSPSALYERLVELTGALAEEAQANWRTALQSDVRAMVEKVFAANAATEPAAIPA